MTAFAPRQPDATPAVSTLPGGHQPNQQGELVARIEPATAQDVHYATDPRIRHLTEAAEQAEAQDG